MRSVLFVLSIAAHTAFAQTLVPLKSLSAKERTELADASRASFNFRFDPGVNCTGTFVSDKGYFLTALHCLSACLIKQNALTKSPATDDPLAFGARKAHVYLMTVDEHRIDEGIECSGSMNGKPFIATVIMTGGKGWMTPKTRIAALAKQYPNEYRKLLDDGYEHGYDFAILKTTGATSCLPLASSRPAVGDLLRAIPFACVDRKTWRASGQLALFTKGIRTEGFAKSEMYKSRGPASLPFSKELIDRPDTFFSSLDLEKCGSGTGIFDRKNRVVGVATRVYKSSTDYEFGSLEAVSTSRIAREIHDKLDTTVAKDILSCSSPLRKRSPALASKTKGQTQVSNGG